MYIRVDTGEMPPSVTLCEPDDFTRFRVVVTAPRMCGSIRPC